MLNLSISNHHLITNTLKNMWFSRQSKCSDFAQSQLNQKPRKTFAHFAVPPSVPPVSFWLLLWVLISVYLVRSSRWTSLMELFTHGCHRTSPLLHPGSLPVSDFCVRLPGSGGLFSRPCALILLDTPLYTPCGPAPTNPTMKWDVAP